MKMKIKHALEENWNKFLLNLFVEKHFLNMIHNPEAIKAKIIKT
jgi:hypothetical protein